MGAQDLYKVLGVSKDATQQQLEDAYKQRQTPKVVRSCPLQVSMCKGEVSASISTSNDTPKSLQPDFRMILVNRTLSPSCSIYTGPQLIRY